MQAGGCYVPLDPSSPPERLVFMLKDSGARVLLTHNGLDASIPTSATRKVQLPLPCLFHTACPTNTQILAGQVL